MKGAGVLKRIWKRFIIPLVILAIGYFLVDFLLFVINNDASDKALSIAILSLALVIGLAHFILLFINNGKLHSGETVQKHRKVVVRFHDFIRYTTPFVLVATLYFFWSHEWVLSAIIAGILLLDRMNDLARIR